MAQDAQCRKFATATLFRNSGQSVIYQTNFATTTIVNQGVASLSVLTFVHSYTSRQSAPTATLYGTSCRQTLNAAPTTAAASSTVGSSPAAASVQAAAVSRTDINGPAQQLSVKSDGRGIATRTVVRSATSPVAVVTSTSSPNTRAPDSTQDAQTSVDQNVEHKTSHTGAIAGGIIGGVAAFVLFGLLVWLFRKRHRRERDTRNLDEFFNDPKSVGWNPEDDDGTAAAVGGSRYSTRRTRRKSVPRMLDLEKESRRRDDNGNWAALMAQNDSENGHADHGDSEDAAEILSNGRPLSQHSATGRSRAMSVQSISAAAFDIAQPGHLAAPVGVQSSRNSSGEEVPRVTDARDNLLRGSSYGSAGSGYLSSKQLQGDPVVPDHVMEPETIAMRLSPSGPDSVFNFDEDVPRDSCEPYQPYTSRNGRTKPRSLSANSVYSAVDRPKSPLGFGSGNPHSAASPPSSPYYGAAGMPLTNASRPTSPAASMGASMSHGRHMPRAWSPPPVGASSRVPAQPQQVHRFSSMHSYDGNYPPSQYAHLDVREQAGDEPYEETSPEMRARTLSPPLAASRRDRSLSGNALVRPAWQGRTFIPYISSSATPVGALSRPETTLGRSKPSPTNASAKGEHQMPHRSHSVLSVRNADPMDSTPEATEDEEDRLAPAGAAVTAPSRHSGGAESGGSDTPSAAGCSLSTDEERFHSSPGHQHRHQHHEQPLYSSYEDRSMITPLPPAASSPTSPPLGHAMPTSRWTPGKWLVRGASVRQQA